MANSNVFYGQIVDDMQAARDKYVLVARDCNADWKLYKLEGASECSSRSSRSSRYVKQALPFEFLFIDRAAGLAAYRENGCDKRIERIPGPCNDNLSGPDLLKQIGTFSFNIDCSCLTQTRVVGTTVGAPIPPATTAGGFTVPNVDLLVGLAGVTQAAVIPGQIRPVIGRELALNGVFAGIDGQTLIRDQLVIIQVPAEAVAGPALALPAGLIPALTAPLNLTLPAAGGIIAGRVVSSTADRLVIEVFFQTLSIPFLAPQLVDLVNSLLPLVGGAILTAAGPLLNSLLVGPTLIQNSSLRVFSLFSTEEGQEQSIQAALRQLAL